VSQLGTITEPISFGKTFKIPPYDGPLHLEKKNPHELDKRIQFIEESHTYLFDNQQLDFSVTQLAEKFFEKFDSDLVIERMMNGPNWPRPEYLSRGVPMTPEEIKLKWDSIGEYARNRGSWMHYNIERHLNGLEYSNALPEMKQFFDFEKEVRCPFLTVQNHNLIMFYKITKK